MRLINAVDYDIEGYKLLFNTYLVYMNITIIIKK